MGQRWKFYSRADVATDLGFTTNNNCCNVVLTRAKKRLIIIMGMHQGQNILSLVIIRDPGGHPYHTRYIIGQYRQRCSWQLPPTEPLATPGPKESERLDLMAGFGSA